MARTPVAHMQAVEIDEPGWDPRDAVPPAGRPDGLRLRRGHVVVALVGVLVLLVGTLVVGAVARDRDEARSDRIAAIPGMLRPLSTAPAELWRLQVPMVDGGLLAADGRLVVLHEQGGAWQLTGHEPGTGELLWSLPVVAADRAGFEGGTVTCPTAGPDVGPLVLCEISGSTTTYAQDGAELATPTSQVVAVDARTGTLVASWDVPVQVLELGRVDDDLVLAVAEADGHVRVSRVVGRTGEVAWTYRSPDIMHSLSIFRQATLRVGTELVVIGGSATIVLDLDDGRELLEGSAYRTVQVVMVGERFGTWTAQAGGELWDRDSGRLFSLPGLPVRLSAQDGSTADVVISDLGAELAAVDAQDGTPLWRIPSQLDPQLAAGGGFLLTGPSRFAVIDAGTGQTRWTVSLREPLRWRPLTDGALVVGPDSAPDGSDVLVGRGLDDGARYWQVPVPDGVQRVQSVGGHLVVRTWRELLVLG